MYCAKAAEAASRQQPKAAAGMIFRILSSNERRV
jgi:hypothetical protein